MSGKIFNLVCKQADFPAIDQRIKSASIRQVTTKILQRSFRNKEAIHFRTREDYKDKLNFLDGLERRKTTRKVKISHLYDGRHFFSWRGSGLKTILASISCSRQPITGFLSPLIGTSQVAQARYMSSYMLTFT